jgi:hypothetical protein
MLRTRVLGSAERQPARPVVTASLDLAARLPRLILEARRVSASLHGIQCRFKLAQLSDFFMGHLSDSTQTDGMKRINLYRSYENQTWDLIGALVVQEVLESSQFEGEDGTKYMVEPAISDHPSSYGTYTVSVKTTSRRLAAEVAREFHDNCKKVYENRD